MGYGTDKYARREARWGTLPGREPRGTMSDAQLLKLALTPPRQRCCRKTRRCRNCPVVVNQMNRAITRGSGDIDFAALAGIAQRARVR
ncbi:hypothetical protein [Corynebacterium sp. 335C]